MNELYLGIVGAMSLGSLGFVWKLLSLPWCDDVRPVRAPVIVASVPDMTFDCRGMV